MRFFPRVRGFLRAFRSGSGAGRPKHHGDAVARTADDALGSRGVSGGWTDKSGVYDRIAEGADGYDRSFDD